MALASSIVGFQVDWIDGVKPEEVHPKSLPEVNYLLSSRGFANTDSGNEPDYYQTYGCSLLASSYECPSHVCTMKLGMIRTDSSQSRRKTARNRAYYGRRCRLGCLPQTAAA
jgi:hypothetical protein